MAGKGYRTGLAMPVIAVAAAGGLALAGWRRAHPKRVCWNDRRTASLIRRLPTPVAVISNDTRVISASRSMADIFRLEPDAMVGKPLDGLIRLSDDTTFDTMLRRLAIDDSEASVASVDGRPMLLRAVDVMEEQGHGWLVLVKDIGQQVQLDRLKADFVSTVSHELRTPLSSIAGALGLVVAGATGPLTEDAGEMVGIALNNTNRLIRLINDLLDVEKIESGRVHFEFKHHSVGRLVENAITAIRPFADEHDVQLIFNQKEGDDTVHVDEDRSIQLFTNLLSNAIKFSPSGESVKVVVKPGAAFQRIKVIDRGPGIPKALHGKIFDKFVQADASGSRQNGGTGLGLTISRQIIDRLDGKLWFESNPEGGTTFFIDLPTRVPRPS